jgi:dihydrofolate reductase
MRTITVIENVTLDGVVQAPGRPDEDPRGGFAHGGWAAPYAADPAHLRILGEHLSGAWELLLGRWTYELLRASWSGRADNPFSPVLDAARKHVVSRSRQEPLVWARSTLHRDVEAVVALRASEGPDLVVMGSGTLVAALLAADLVDGLVLLTYPLVLGSGRRLFADGGPPARLALKDVTPTGAGVLVAHYTLDGAR